MPLLRLFEGRERLGYDSLIVMEEAASQQRRHREDRQDGDHTHYHKSLYARQLRDQRSQSCLAIDLVAKLQQAA
jgi:hypothetical protein